MRTVNWEQMDRAFHRWLMRASMEERIKLYRFLMRKHGELEKACETFKFSDMLIGVDVGFEDKAVMVTCEQTPQGLKVLDSVTIENLQEANRDGLDLAR